jgi:porphobilinogen synthase
MSFPNTRLRKTRINQTVRDRVAETRLSVTDLIMPLFVVDGEDKKEPIASMPGIFRLSLDNLLAEAKVIQSLGIPAVLLFGSKDKELVPKAVRLLKGKLPNLTVITDVCLCAYTESGHCHVGDNDQTIELLAEIAVTHAKAGADIVAPSAMMDGQVGAIRKALNENGLKKTKIMAYSAKYASSFYGPFREVAGSAPKSGDRKSYQMDFRNSDEALREIELDIEEGADIVMVKPALAYLDVIRRVKDKFDIPLAAYNVSGEYAMLKAASEKGWLDEEQAILETLTAIKRAGGDFIISYHAKAIAGII